MIGYRIRGLDPAPFAPLYGLSDAELGARGVIRMTVAACPGAPCRVTLADVEAGGQVLLLNHEYQAADTPYRGRHAIFVREGAMRAADHVDTVPAVLATRLLSVRAYDVGHMMVDADVVEGRDLETVVERFLADPGVAYLHAHNAKRGCFAARIDRR